jgi:hypothetical protein
MYPTNGLLSQEFSDITEHLFIARLNFNPYGLVCAFEYNLVPFRD